MKTRPLPETPRRTDGGSLFQEWARSDFDPDFPASLRSREKKALDEFVAEMRDAQDLDPIENLKAWKKNDPLDYLIEWEEPDLDDPEVRAAVFVRLVDLIHQNSGKLRFVPTGEGIVAGAKKGGEKRSTAERDVAFAKMCKEEEERQEAEKVRRPYGHFDNPTAIAAKLGEKFRFEGKQYRLGESGALKARNRGLKILKKRADLPD